MGLHAGRSLRETGRHGLENQKDLKIFRGSLAGAGIGLRFPHFDQILSERPAIPWFEILVDNIMGDAREFYAKLDRLRQDYPFVFHGVSMNLGSVDPLNQVYFAELRELITRYQPLHVSEHLAWTGVNARFHHDLLPLPYTEESLAHMKSRVAQAQDLLGQRIVIENPSSYFAFKESSIAEWDFLSEVVTAADTGILLDVNNIYVSASNHGYQPTRYLEALPLDRITYIHLAGYQDCKTYLFDSHGQKVWPQVWELYQQTIEQAGPLPTLIEWDSDIPTLEELMAEAAQAQRILSGERYEAG